MGTIYYTPINIDHENRHLLEEGFQSPTDGRVYVCCAFRGCEWPSRAQNLEKDMSKRCLWALGIQPPKMCVKQEQVVGLIIKCACFIKNWDNQQFNGNFRDLKWGYCTIFLAIFCGDIPWNFGLKKMVGTSNLVSWDDQQFLTKLLNYQELGSVSSRVWNLIIELFEERSGWRTRIACEKWFTALPTGCCWTQLGHSLWECGAGSCDLGWGRWRFWCELSDPVGVKTSPEIDESRDSTHCRDESRLYQHLSWSHCKWWLQNKKTAHFQFNFHYT